MINLLDTNICIYHLNNRSERVSNFFKSYKHYEIAICSIVKAELLYGALKSSKPELNLKKVILFMDNLFSFPFDDIAAEVYAKLRSDLEKTGKSIGPNDLIIASIAIANDLTLITHNTKEFNRVQGLKFLD